jgi:phenylacetate-coenzyme A ligase PaaK-like adenylate-forming protein
MTTIFDDYPSIVERFQVHQASDYSIAIKVVCHCRDKKARDILEGIRSNVLACTGNEVEVRVEFVDRINTDRGKLRFIISDVA